MQIVIDIPEELYNNIQKDCGIYSYRLVYDAMKNGTPLPTDAVDRVTIKEYLSSCEVPYQKIGKWRTVKHYGRDYYQCTYCSMERINDHSRGWNYCPFCGAKMSDVEDKNET